jgi:hypothetical protein
MNHIFGINMVSKWILGSFFDNWRNEYNESLFIYTYHFEVSDPNFLQDLDSQVLDSRQN